VLLLVFFSLSRSSFSSSLEEKNLAVYKFWGEGVQKIQKKFKKFGRAFFFSPSVFLCALRVENTETAARGTR